MSHLDKTSHEQKKVTADQLCATKIWAKKLVESKYGICDRIVMLCLRLKVEEQWREEVHEMWKMQHNPTHTSIQVEPDDELLLPATSTTVSL